MIQHEAGPAADLRRVKVPLPFPLRFVNAYLVKGGDGYTLLDPGLHTPEAEKLWQETLQEAGIAFADITQIVLTHHHPDHYGMAGWFQERCGAPVRLSAEGQAQAAQLWGEGQPLSGEIHRLFIRHGMIGEHEDQIMPHFSSFVPLVSPQPKLSAIAAGDYIRIGDRRCLAIHTPGHAFGHLCFYDADRREMFCGDHVLPQISPNVSYLPDVDDNPLASFLESLAEIGRFDVERAYPGHREPFAAFARRTEELIAHHKERLELMRGKLAVRAMNAYELCLDVFGSRLSIHQLRFAMAETLAHLVWLREEGRVLEKERDGVFVYSV